MEAGITTVKAKF